MKKRKPHLSKYKVIKGNQRQKDKLTMEEQERITADLSETTQARQQWREEKSVNIPWKFHIPWKCPSKVREKNFLKQKQNIYWQYI